jgi:hypothetical protein
MWETHMTFTGGLRLRRSAIVTPVLLLCITAAALAQRGYGYGFTPQAKNPHYDGRFMFARLKYACFGNCYYYYSLPSWAHGYPRSEENLMKIMDAVTDLHPHLDNSVVMTIDDPELSKFPVAYMTEASFWLMTDKEGPALRAYLQKGGFVIFDDFRNDYRRGSGGLANLEGNLQRAIPGAQLLPMDVTHKIFHIFFEINSFDVIPQDYDTGRPVLLGLFDDNDPNKRLMAIINFNTDVSNWWEFSGQGFRPVNDTNEAYKLGVNYVIYGLTH